MTVLRTRIIRVSMFIINALLLTSSLSWGSNNSSSEAGNAKAQTERLTFNAPSRSGIEVSPLSDDYGTVDISWTAPGDDSTFGTADHYVIKYYESAINESNWDSAMIVANPPTPLPSGTNQSFVVNSLYPGQFYYLAMKTYDDAGNVSVLSNLAMKYASGIARPALLGAEIDSVNSSATLSARIVNSHLAVYYEFALDTTIEFSHPVVDVALIADTTARVSFGGLQPVIAYFWRCRAMAQDHSDSSLWSGPASFVLNDIIAPIVTITSPNNGDTLRADTAVVSWYANHNGPIAAYYVGYSTDSGANWQQISQGIDTCGSIVWQLPPSGDQFLVGVLYLDIAQNPGGDTVTVYRAPTSIGNESNMIPVDFELQQSYPNPFNAVATIGYSLPTASQVTLEIYDLLGNKVITLHDGYDAAGYHQYLWQAGQLASGTYLYRLKAGAFEMVKFTTLIK